MRLAFQKPRKLKFQMLIQFFFFVILYSLVYNQVSEYIFDHRCARIREVDDLKAHQQHNLTGTIFLVWAISEVKKLFKQQFFMQTYVQSLLKKIPFWVFCLNFSWGCFFYTGVYIIDYPFVWLILNCKITIIKVIFIYE